MADESKIKQRIELDGEKEYNAALKEAQRNLKTLRSELKAETAELGKNATEQQKAETKAKNLQKQIKEQEKVVKTYQAALDEVREKYGDNADAVAKYEQKLNDARATLANMKNSLDDVGDAFDGIKEGAAAGVTATKSLADSLKSVGDSAGSISDALEAAFSSVLGSIQSIISDIWAEIYDIAAKSNNWTDLAGMFGTSATDIQKWDNILKGAGKDFSLFSGIMSKLVKGKSGKDLTEWLGITNANYENQLDYTLLVLDKLREAQGKMGATAFNKRLSQTKDLKGSEDDIRWILANWESLFGEEAQSRFDVNRGGVGLSEEQISDLNDLYLKVETLKTSWAALKDMAVVSLFGSLSLSITGNLQNIVDAFKDYFAADTQSERDAALQKVKDNIVEIFKNIKTAIDEGLKLLDDLAEELKDSPDSTARALGNVLDTIVKALSWFTKEENWGAVKTGFEALIAVWAAGKVASAVGNIASFAANIATIKGGGGLLFGNGFGWGLGGTGATDLSSTITGAVTACAGPLASAIAGITMSVGLVALAVPVIAEIKKMIAGESNADKSAGELLLPDADKETQQRITEQLGHVNLDRTVANGKDALHWLFGGGSQGSETTVEDNTPTVNLPSTIYIPSPRANSKFAVTEEQKAAAEAFWDVWKTGDYSDEQYDAAFDALEKAFGGSEGTLDNLITWLGKLYDAMTENENSTEYDPDAWTDIPSTWWMKTTGTDAVGFKSIPGEMRAAVQNGMSNIRVYMDGQIVGNLVAPYVSEQIARDMA